MLARLLGAPVARLVLGALRLSARKSGLAVYYHALAQRSGDKLTEIVPAHGRRLFEGQLRHLRSCYRVVPASELLAAVHARRRGQRFPVAITFDDDLASHVKTAMPALQRLGLGATFFLNGVSLERPVCFWWQRLQRAVDRGADVARGLELDQAPREDWRPAGRIHELAASIKHMAPAQRDAAAERLLALAGPDPPDSGVRAAQVQALAEAGFEVGFHTLHHYHLPGLDDAQLASAMRAGRERIEALADRPLTTIAYPHGGADKRVAAAARDAGFELGFTASGRRVEPGDDPLLLSRIEPSFSSPGRFALKLARALTMGD